LLSSLGSVVAFVIVIILLAVFALLALGITPDYILRKVRERHIANAQRKAEEKEMLAIQQREAEEEARKAQAQKPKSAAAVAPVPPRMTAQAPKTEETPAREVTVDEIIAESSGVAPASLKADAAEELRAQSIHIGPSAEQAAKNAASAPKTPSGSTSNDTPLDFGGDDDFYRAEMKRLCLAAKKMNLPLELNCVGVKQNRCYPNEKFWRIVGDVGNKVIIGVDAHYPEAFLEKETVRRCEEISRKFELFPLRELKFVNPKE
jgi:hypothetical protein